MAFKCPHCSEGIDGVLTQEAHLERLKAKTAENDVLKETLKAANVKAKDYDTVFAERDRFRNEVEGIKTATERKAAFDAAGIPDAVRPSFEVIYNSHIAAFADDARPALADWLTADATKADPFLAPHFVQPAAEQPPKAPAPKAPAAPAPKLDNGIVQSPTGSGTGIKTGAELQAYFRSDQYRALPADEQKRVMAELKSKVPVNA